MKIESDIWTGHVDDLSICCHNSLPYILSCRLRSEGGDWRWAYFSVDDDIPQPMPEHEALKNWILPRLKKQ